MLDEITYSPLNINGCTIEVWESISHFIHPTPHWVYDYLSMLWLKLICVSKRWPISHYDTHSYDMIFGRAQQLYE